ncbi:unnamed protein product [Caenorhabditis angaria]|uniref:Uncharacterized protein n=1 Tax=Caenorhabditis angaria TaxID=860376 RepID=A0A9P1IX50_9PELO|nr:unnamed protein product [Caenorhabditis angaria]
MEHTGSPPITNNDLQTLIASIPRDLSITSGSVTTSKTPSSVGDLSATSSNSCIFPPVNDMAALTSMFTLSGYPQLFNGFPLIPTLPLFNTALPPHATIESLGLINSAIYQQQAQAQSQSQTALSSPSATMNSTSNSSKLDSRPRAFSSAATLQHAKPQDLIEKRRKRSRKSDTLLPAVTQSIPCSTTSSPSTTTVSQNTPTTTSHLRSLLEDDDDIDVPHPNKVRPIQVTKEEEELVRKKTQEILKTVPITAPSHLDNGPLRRLIRDEDLPDEVGPDSPFRHYPKYQQQKSRTQLVMLQGIQSAVASLYIEAFQIDSKSDAEKAEIRRISHGNSINDLVNDTVLQELIAAE